MPQIGKTLIIIGVILIIAGILIYFAGNKMSWIGHLPGDIRIERENMKFYFPLTTMIIISLLISLVLWILRKLF
ncbi:MAG: DUF2905 domain-containing protein [Bacteroidales bacterium]|nr:DUF2905 domain-containing protein [Bacteroidales bacterium]